MPSWRATHHRPAGGGQLADTLAGKPARQKAARCRGFEWCARGVADGGHRSLRDFTRARAHTEGLGEPLVLSAKWRNQHQNGWEPTGQGVRHPSATRPPWRAGPEASQW